MRKAAAVRVEGSSRRGEVVRGRETWWFQSAVAKVASVALTWRALSNRFPELDERNAHLGGLHLDAQETG